MERFESAPTFLRVQLVWLAGKLFDVGSSAHAIPRRVSMLDVTYGRLPLLKSDASPIGSRVPDAIGPDGRRLFGGQWSAFVLHAGCEVIARKLAVALHLPLSDGDVAELTRFFGRDRFVAVIRPDRIVGWVGGWESVDIEGCAVALGRLPSPAARQTPPNPQRTHGG